MHAPSLPPQPVSVSLVSPAANPVGAGVTAMSIKLPETAGTVTVSYFVQCSDLQSPPSAATNITVVTSAP